MFQEAETYGSVSIAKWDSLAKKHKIAAGTLDDYFKKTEAGSRSLDNYTKYLNENSKALTVNTLKTKALNIAKSAAVNIGIALGTALVGKGIELFYENVIKANEKAIDTANDLQNKYQDLQSEVTSLEEKLQDNQKKIEDINANPLNIINENTLTALQKENGELERQLELKRQLAEDAKRESGAAAYDILNKKTERSSTKKTSELQAMLDSGYAGKWVNSFGHWLNAALGGGNTSAYISVPERAKEQIEELSELKNKLREFDSDSITYDKDTADITEKINSQTEALRKNIEFIGKQKSAYDLTDPEQKEQYDYLVKLEDAYLALQVYSEDMDSFDEIWNAKATADQKNELIALAKQGELTAEKFEKDYHVLAVLFEALGYSIDEIIEKLKGMEAESIIPKTAEDFQKTFDELNKQIDKIQSAYSTVKSAIEEYNEQGYLSVDTYQELLQLSPEYMSMLIDENGQLTLTKDSWRLLTEAKIKDMYQTQVNQYVESLKAAADSGNKEKIDELTDAYRNLTAAKVDASTVALADLNLSDEQRAGAEAYLASLRDAMNATISGLDFGGMSQQDKSTKDKANKIKEINKKLAELSKKESLEILKQGIEEQKALIDQFTKSVDIQDLKLELADDSDYSAKMDALSSKYDLLQGKTVAMRSEFERLNGITPTSADEAQELASRMESLGDEMRSNVKDVIELRREMELLNVNMVSKSAENAQAQLERTMKRLDRDIKNITDGNIFSDNVFNIDSMLPVVSESALTKKRKENDKLIREEERYQSDINRIILTSLQMQKEENAQARAEERASLLEDLNELKGVVSTKSAEIKQEATRKANETSVEVLNKVGEIKSGITTAIGDIANMTIEPPKMNTEAWDNLENDIKDRFNRILSPAANSSADAMSAVGLASQFVGQNNTGFRFSGGRNEEWCADFVSYIADMAGIPIEQLPRSPGVIDFYNFFAEHGGNLNTPKPGDIVIFDKGKHIGFVEAVTENGITTIEGNTRNRNNEKSLVTRNNYSLDDIKKRNMTFGRYASGGYADGYAVVGDNPSGANVKRPELAIYPDGRVEVVGQNGVELKAFPPGTRIIPYDKAKEILSRTSSVPRYADGTNEAQRQKFNDLVSKYSTPNYYDKSFASEYADYANGRSITITNIKATVDKLTDLDINSEDYKNLRRSALDMVDAQRLSDAEMLLSMQESELKKTGASYQEFYDELLSEYRDYIEKVNAGDSEEIYDEEVVQKYIDTLSDLEDKIGDVNDEMSTLLQTTIETYQKLDSIKIQKGRELVSATDYEISDLEYLRSLTDNPSRQTEYSKQIIGKIEEKIAQEKAIQTTAHEAANKLREEFSKEIDGNYDIDSWFDKEGEFTTAYSETLSLIADEEQKSRIQIYASRIQTEKKAYMESNQNMKEARQSLNDANKQLDDDLLNRLREAMDNEVKALERSISEQKKTLDFEISQYAARNTLLQKHYDILNSIADEQHNITKELDASLTMYEYLDEETRKLIFNQEDYNKLKLELVGLEGEAEDLQRRYLNAIKGADAENISKITADYERQYELLMKSYEISKAELEVAKKRQQLDNVLNERNVRMLINGKWEWVANTQDVINAQNELADAEYNKINAENQLEQTKNLQSLQAHQDTLEMQKNYLDAELTDMTERWDKIMERMEGNTESVSEVLDLIAINGGEGLHKIANRVGNALVDLYGDITELLGQRETLSNAFESDIDYSALMSELPKGSFLWKHLNNKRNNKIDALGLSYNKYASGTISAKKGLGIFDDEGLGSEMVMTSQGILTKFNGGEKVFSKAQTDKLWELSKFNIGDLTKNLIPNIVPKQAVVSDNHSVSYGDIIVNNPVDYNDFMDKLNTSIKMRAPITKNSY